MLRSERVCVQYGGVTCGPRKENVSTNLSYPENWEPISARSLGRGLVIFFLLLLLDELPWEEGGLDEPFLVAAVEVPCWFLLSLGEMVSMMWRHLRYSCGVCDDREYEWRYIGDMGIVFELCVSVGRAVCAYVVIGID